MNIRETLKKRFDGKNCRVLGFARSNKPLVEILIEAGARVTVHDKNENVINDEKYIDYKLRKEAERDGVKISFLAIVGGMFVLLAIICSMIYMM